MAFFWQAESPQRDREEESHLLTPGQKGRHVYSSNHRRSTNKNTNRIPKSLGVDASLRATYDHVLLTSSIRRRNESEGCGCKTCFCCTVAAIRAKDCGWWLIRLLLSFLILLGLLHGTPERKDIVWSLHSDSPPRICRAPTFLQRCRLARVVHPRPGTTDTDVDDDDDDDDDVERNVIVRVWQSPWSDCPSSLALWRKHKKETLGAPTRAHKRQGHIGDASSPSVSVRTRVTQRSFEFNATTITTSARKGKRERWHSLDSSVGGVGERSEFYHVAKGAILDITLVYHPSDGSDSNNSVAENTTTSLSGRLQFGILLSRSSSNEEKKDEEVEEEITVSVKEEEKEERKSIFYEDVHMRLPHLSTEFLRVIFQAPETTVYKVTYPVSITPLHRTNGANSTTTTTEDVRSKESNELLEMTSIVRLYHNNSYPDFSRHKKHATTTFHAIYFPIHVYDSRHSRWHVHRGTRASFSSSSLSNTAFHKAFRCVLVETVPLLNHVPDNVMTQATKENDMENEDENFSVPATSPDRVLLHLRLQRSWVLILALAAIPLVAGCRLCC